MQGILRGLEYDYHFLTKAIQLMIDSFEVVVLLHLGVQVAYGLFDPVFITDSDLVLLDPVWESCYGRCSPTVRANQVIEKCDLMMRL